MKKKIVMSVMLTLSLSTMFLNWFGGMKGVQEVTGLLMLDNPIAITCIFLTYIGIWTDYSHSETIGSIGMIGIITMEIYELFTWYILTVTGYFDIQFSLSLTYPEFWLALFCMIGTYAFYHFTNKEENLT